jgi:isopentenyl diphosphate isomerase/L-lactate dehydrogenase-like FMN-dependent dehydrogenase
MGVIENRWRFSAGRRKALASLAAIFAGSPLLRGQIDPHSLIGHRRVLGLDEMIDAFDFEAVCFRNMEYERYDYMAHGDGSEWNLRRNRQAFDWVDIVPGKAVDPKSVDMSTEILGIKLTHPIFVAPSSGQGALHPDGEMGMYRGATAANTIMAIANGPSIPHARIAAAATGPRFNQFYPVPDLGASLKTLQTFQDLGTKAIIISVDQQASYYERDLHNRNLGGNPRTPGSTGRGRGAGAPVGGGAAADAALEGVAPTRAGGAAAGPVAMMGAGDHPATPRFPTISKYRVPQRRLWYSWQYINELRKAIKVPVIIKGIVTAEDAQDCVREGVDGIIVSNHGGRSMDYGPSTLEVLPEIAAVVNKKFPVLIDSGFRRGSDVFKALALGADGVELGRAARWGLGAFGPAGAQRLLDLLQAELVQAAAHAGRPTIKSIDKTAVKANFV